MFFGWNCAAEKRCMLPFVNEPLGSIVHAKRMWLLASFVVKLWRSIEPMLNGFGNLIFIVFQVYWCIFCSSLSQNTSTWLNPLWHHIVSPSLFGRASQACVSSCNLRVSGEEGEGAEQGQIQNNLLFASGRRSRPDANILTGDYSSDLGKRCAKIAW